ncbi:hypothetical protein [Candidatus Binatus sp.]|uniref:hypothetical protein n=1 Tax=Candidatus Binatus sp. TaxID=2811406 RepID=UPI003C8EA44D
MNTGFPRSAFCRRLQRIVVVAGALVLAIGAACARPCMAGDASLLTDQGHAQPDGLSVTHGAAASSQTQLGAGAGNQVLEIPLPERFSGCWRGVAVLDSLRELNGLWPSVKWSPKTYRVCFVERGLGEWQFTFGENHIDPENSNSDEREQSINFLRMEGSAAVLEARLVLGSRPTGRYTTHEDTTLRCELSDSPAASSLRVSGDVLVDVDGEPWRAATWHADFARTGE